MDKCRGVKTGFDPVTFRAQMQSAENCPCPECLRRSLNRAKRMNILRGYVVWAATNDYLYRKRSR